MVILFIAVLVFLADQSTKAFVNENILPGSYVEIVKDKFYLTNIKNDGAAYGFLAGKRRVLLAATAASFAGLVWMFREAFQKGAAAGKKLSFALIIGGAIGNFYDRITKKTVTDFLYVKVKNAPIFNVADMAILLGMIWRILREIRRK